jgi:uncharacterized protein (DUF1697 family)
MLLSGGRVQSHIRAAPASPRDLIMRRYIAFLRAINVGGHTVKMADLRTLFLQLDFEGVETYIASGNVWFRAATKDRKLLEHRIERHLQDRLGYEVATFVRTTTDLAQLGEDRPFGDVKLTRDGNTLYVAFVRDPLDSAAKSRLFTHRTRVDDFQVRGAEVFWLWRREVGDSDFSGAVLEKAVEGPATVRNWNTVRKLAARCAAD